ncbi:MAG: tRNA (adenosine(37)-N6)-dimethylallyltransferase MiaA [Rikenellaceae bacterium]|nr:tRNA (adenosine(37)-N6)-dimethylallyltransferase MiaA [Rikenellaceae bacterium]
MNTENTAPTLIVIVGATGSGKTDLSIALANRFRAPILSTDSRQVFRGMPIGTAQPTAEQLAAAEHHFIATLDIDQPFSCGMFESQALELLDRLFLTHRYAVAVGGSGLYVRALCEGMDELPEADEALRARLRQRLEQQGLPALCDELQRLDPIYHATVDLDNPARVMRALEVCLLSGRPYSSLRLARTAKRPFRIVKIGIDIPREVLYGRIDRRVDAMMAAGLEAEARRLYPYRHLNSLQTVGYKELFDYFDGLTSREQAVELIKRNSRRYAKRQLTWFRRDKQIAWFAPDDIRSMEQHILHDTPA